MAQRYLPIGAPGGAPISRAGGRLDVVGLGLIAVAVLALLNGMVHLHAATLDLGLALLACSVVATVGFVVHQRRGARPLMALGLFEHRAFAMGGTVAFIYGMALFGSTYLVPVFMQEALHLPPSQAGAVLLPAGLVLAVTIPLAGRLADRVAVSRMVSVGLVLLAASFFLMLKRRPGDLAGADHALGRGRPARPRPHHAVAQPRLDARPSPALIAQGSSTINFLRQLGGAVGIGLVGNVLEWRLRTHAGEPLAAFHETFALIGAITACAIVAAWRMGPQTERRPAAGASKSS